MQSKRSLGALSPLIQTFRLAAETRVSFPPISELKPALNFIVDSDSISCTPQFGLVLGRIVRPMGTRVDEKLRLIDLNRLSIVKELYGLKRNNPDQSGS